MRLIRWAIVVVLVALELVMKDHVWFIMDKVSVFSASDGWHRAFLIDRAIFNFFDWWLVGTKSTESWGYSLWDVTNGYIREGVNGGLITLVLFISLITRCFRAIGRSVVAAESRNIQIFVWGLGAALLAHVTTYFSVSYFDQNLVNWVLLLAMISTVCTQLLDTRLRIQKITQDPALLENIYDEQRTFVPSL